MKDERILPQVVLLVLVLFGRSDWAGGATEPTDANKNYPKNSDCERQQWCGYVNVLLETEKDVFAGPPSSLKVTFRIEPVRNQDPVFFIVADAITGGAGLVVEHIGPDGTATSQSQKYNSGWDSEGGFVRITSPAAIHKVPSLYLVMWVGPLHALFDFSERGIYHISYVHPWEDMKGTNMTFGSRTKTIAIVSQARLNQLNSMLRANPQLALASYKFKHPAASPRGRAITRSEYLNEIDRAISTGCSPEEVLFLLGSPDCVGRSNRGGPDQQWLYETGPVSSYSIYFKDGIVVSKARGGDSPWPP